MVWNLVPVSRMALMYMSDPKVSRSPAHFRVSHDLYKQHTMAKARSDIARQEPSQYTQVRLPDLFILFLSEPPIVNPHYAAVRKESEAWVAESETPPLHPHARYARNEILIYSQAVLYGQALSNDPQSVQLCVVPVDRCPRCRSPRTTNCCGLGKLGMSLHLITRSLFKTR